MVKRRLPRSLRKFIRKEKARIRREVFDLKEQEKQIQELYQKIPRTRNFVSVQNQSSTELHSGAGFEKIKTKEQSLQKTS